MKKRILATACAAILCLCGCAAGGGAGTNALPADESTVPVVEETLEDTGIDRFVTIPEYKGVALTKEAVEVTASISTGSTFRIWKSRITSG